MLWVSGMFAAGCVSTEDTRFESRKESDSLRSDTVLTDFARQVLSRPTEDEQLMTLSGLLRRLVDEEREDAHFDRERVSSDFLFHDDAISRLLRLLPVASPEHEVVRKHLLCFIGDASDFEETDPQTAFKSRPLAVALPAFPDLMDALGAIRSQLNFPEEHFRVAGMYSNKKLTKAYVKLVTGAGAFNSEGWGLMFHRSPSGWELVWSRSEWIS